MGKLNQAIVYVCDEARSHQLLMSVASWRRFKLDFSVRVIDLGLSRLTRQRLRIICGDVEFREPLDWLDVRHIPTDEPMRYEAYLQKTLVGRMGLAERILFLDSDILVVSTDFFSIFAKDFGPGQQAPDKQDGLLASPSAWDTDLTFTYNSECLPALRRHSRFPDLELSFRLANSGVWRMDEGTAAAVSREWWRGYKGAVTDVELWKRINPGRRIGDQEFMTMACHRLNVPWVKLHGSYNMQIHQSRMPWTPGPDGIPLGGHPEEAPAPVKAIHFGWQADYTVHIHESFIQDSAIRDWIGRQYAETAASLRAIR